MAIDSYLTHQDLNYLIDLCTAILTIPNHPQSSESSPIIQDMRYSIISELHRYKRRLTDDVEGDIIAFDCDQLLNSVRGSPAAVKGLLDAFKRMGDM